MNKIYGEIAVVTPEEAKNILETRNTVNRPIDKRQVARYAASMKAGAWRINGECLVFAPDGTLLDGQNRLAAVVKAGVSIPFCVWHNIPEDARSSMDSGKKRTAADVLHFKGYRHANIMAPIVRMAYVYDVLDRSMNLSGKAHEVNTDVIERYADYLSPDISDSTGMAASFRHWLKPSVIGFCHLIFSRRNKALAFRFFQLLRTGAYLAEGHPVRTLYMKLAWAYGNGKSGLSVRRQIAMFIKAWNAFVANRPLTDLEWDAKTEAFPAVA